MSVEDLVQWLKARLDEDERTARAACEYASPNWHLDEEFGETVLWWPPEPHIAEKEREKGLPVVSDQWRGETVGKRIAPHIAAWDPARVLRETDAKRQLIGQFVEACAYYDKNRAAPAGEVHGLRTALRLLATVYADRDGYQESWRP